MPVTIAEIQQAVGANPALMGEIAQNLGKDIVPLLVKDPESIKLIVPKIKESGFIIRTQDEEKSFLASYEQNQEFIDRIMAPRIKEVHDLYDRDYEQLFGEKRNPNEKTYNAYKRKVDEIKASRIGDPVIKEQLTTLQTTLQTEQNEHRTAIEKLEKDYFTRELGYLVSSALDTVNIAIPAQLKTDEEKQKYIASQKSMMKRDMLENVTAKKDKDGNIIFYEGDKPLNSLTDGKPLQATDIIKNRYTYYIAAGASTQGGAGTGGQGGTDAKFTTKDQVHQHLVAKGLDPSTKAFTDEYGKLVKEHGILN